MRVKYIMYYYYFFFLKIRSVFDYVKKYLLKYYVNNDSYECFGLD